MTTKLIARLEAAAEGARELDVAIAKAVGAWRKPPPTVVDPHWTALHYTTSLDAAMTLVPDQIECGTINFSRNKTGRQYCHTTLEQSADSLGRDMRDDEPTEIEALNVATPALALCIAALKARLP